MRKMNNYWLFLPQWNDAFLENDNGSWTVRLPHHIKDLPLHYSGPRDYEGIVGYKRYFSVPEEWKGRRQFIRFDGAAHIAEVYCNGIRLGVHRSGYTAFRFELTSCLKYGEKNCIVVKLDTSENPSVPPFGFVIDYLTYGGLYRDVWLENRSETYIESVYAVTPTLTSAMIQVKINGHPKGKTTRISIRYNEEVLAEKQMKALEPVCVMSCAKAHPWSVDDPQLYTCRVELLADGLVIDRHEHQMGFRTVSFENDQFLLNGKPLFIRGLNRHQSYPYMGYAAGEHLQRYDARILKYELGVNAVRTSHYPQSHYFLDECDRLGLLVFTEIPGWQHIGDKTWIEQAKENTREMILEYRNHPSIFLWGVRINESQDNHDFYSATNHIAHTLDPYRPTSGVRYLEHSELLEDVYGYNDFSYSGTGLGAKKKEDVTKANKPLLITEANGHMFPTKSFDTWARRQTHALRHAEVLNQAMKDGKHAGTFQWCMFDYATHKDFGSGDRICYHGVMDSFRNPKPAAAFYESQSDHHPVLEIASSMDIGDYDGGLVGRIAVFTNADEIDLYKNNRYVNTFKPDKHSALKHPPILIDDLIGHLLDEEYSTKQASLIRDCLNDAMRNGLNHLSLASKAKFAYLMGHEHFTYQDAVSLYSRFASNWGSESTVWKVIARKNGAIIAEAVRTPGHQLHLDVRVSQTELTDADTYDSAAVRIRILDENGMIASYAQLPVRFETTGEISLIGPASVSAEGGMCGTYIKTTGEEGKAALTVTAEGLKPVTVTFRIAAGDHYE